MRPKTSSGGLMGAGALIVAQYILSFFVYRLPGIPAIQTLGWCLWGLSLVFGLAPIFILRGQGSVGEGKSFVHTTRLVESSLYAVVRHPQYVGGMLFSLALMLLAQHWMILILGLTSIALIYAGIRIEEQECMDKFGTVYYAYMQRVPQVNFVLGAARVIKAKWSSRGDETTHRPRR